MKFLLLILVLQVTTSGAVSLTKHISLKENDEEVALVSMNMIEFIQLDFCL